MGKSKGTRYTKAEREELLELYRQSGYGVTRFCREMDISYATLKRWMGENSQDEAVSFVEIEAGAARSDAPALSARLPNGIVCELGARLEPAQAARWIRELMRC